MKIVCRKENDVNKMLDLVKHLLKAEYDTYSILEEDLVFEVSLKNEEGHCYPDNHETIYLEEKDLQNLQKSDAAILEYYNYDVLTKLYSRGKYEQDIIKLQKLNKLEDFICIYIDAVGLHEVNNHLGHTAGDYMLCSIADGIREHFVNSWYYRIGGDEFVVFCFHQKEAEIQQRICRLRETLQKEEYEISVGMEVSHKDLPLTEIINRAEYAMRYDKEKFYKQDGAKRQMRTLNNKLEEILLEKEDTKKFLNLIASGYKGVYMVNLQTDTFRYIYIPEYFQEIINRNNGVFSKSIRVYCSVFVAESYQAEFLKIFDYDYILQQIKQGNQIKFKYEKKDGSMVNLQITLYDANAVDALEILCIFMEEPENNR